MIRVNLERSDGKSLTLNIPETPAELTLNQKIEFDFAQMEAVSFLKKNEEEIFKSRAGYLLILARGVSKVFEVDLSEIMNLKGQSLLSISENDFFEHLNQLSGEVKNLNKNQLEQNLIHIWSHLSQVVNKAKENPQPETITYKGVQFNLPKLDRNPATGQVIHRSITYQQAVEAIQVNNLYEGWLDNNKEQLGSETQAGLLFTKYLSEVALLLCPDEIPMEPEAFSVWLSLKQAHFQEIDWQTVYWLEKWFGEYMDELRANPENTYFFESTYQAANAEERKAELKSKAQGKKIFRKIGMKAVTAQLMELNPFQKEGLSKIESIMRASFTQVVNLISSHNART